MIYTIKFERRALHELDKLNAFVYRRIVKNIKDLEHNFSSKDIKRLKVDDVYRLRVGDYRVLFVIEKELIKIIKMGHRKNIYKR
jgi:mRNA interferase RelE/StbE